MCIVIGKFAIIMAHRANVIGKSDILSHPKHHLQSPRDFLAALVRESLLQDKRQTQRTLGAGSPVWRGAVSEETNMRHDLVSRPTIQMGSTLQCLVIKRADYNGPTHYRTCMRQIPNPSA